MDTPFPGFGGTGSGRGGFNIFEAFEGLRDAFVSSVGTPTPPPPRQSARMGRGDVRTAILVLLAEEPMHGYQLIQQIESRTMGAWKPSPGSVYPTLQMLADEGLVSSEEDGDRKVYALTEAGRDAAATAADGPLPWDSPNVRNAERMSALPKAGVKLAQAALQLQHTGSPEQLERAVEIVDDARRALYAILAED